MAYQLWNLEYLPIKSWDETVAWQSYDGTPGFPVTNAFLDFSQMASEHARNAKDPITWTTDNLFWLVGGLWWAMTVWPVVDIAWHVWNARWNDYRRAYNGIATLYNRWANNLNNYLANRWAPTSLTWRRMPSTMVVPQAPAVVATEIPQPEEYLQWVNGEIVAKVANPPVYQYSIGVPTMKQKAKRVVTNELNKMKNSWELWTNLTKTQYLINLYNKLK